MPNFPPKKIVKKPKKKKSVLRRKPEEPVEVYHAEKDPEIINPRLLQLGEHMFLNQKLKLEKPKKVRVSSAQPIRRPNELQQISEKEYLETIYPHINLIDALDGFRVSRVNHDDIHCERDLTKPWFKDFLRRVFESGNLMRYNMFIRRCLKTSPYNERSGYNFALLKRLLKLRSESPKKSYERNTISYLAKII